MSVGRIERRRFLAAGAVVALSGCRARQLAPPAPETFAGVSFQELEAKARGSRVRFAMWSGDEARNRYFRETVAPTLARDFGIQLELAPVADVAEVVNRFLNEKGAGQSGEGSVDLVWMNGENFRTARQAGLLWGPFAELLPNLHLYDAELCARDFGTPVEGMEAPWLRAQFVMAHDLARTPQPPRTFAELRSWMEAHPGRFTYPAPPDFTGSVFLRHVLLSYTGDPAAFTRGFDEARYQVAAKLAFGWLRDVKPFLWRQGQTYPASPQELNRLFANQEVDVSMNYSPMFASRAIERGEFPSTARTFVFTSGAIGNYSFLAIPFHASNPLGAMVTANHLMSPEHLVPALRALGGPYPHRLDALSAGQRAMVEGLPRDEATLPDAVLEAHFLPEPDAAYLVRLERDWRSEVLLQ